MKKLIIFILLVVCMPICFAGCNNKLGKTYWIDSAISMSEFFTSEDYKAAKNIVFNDNLNTLMNKSYGSEYAELESVYTELFKASISYAENYYVLFQVDPQKPNSKFKDSIIDVNNSLKLFVKKVKEFNEDKITYESYMKFTDEQTASSDIEQIRLLKFKRKYLSLISSALKLSENLLTSSKLGYNDFNISQENASVAQRTANVKIAIYETNSELVRISVNMLELYNNKDKYLEYSKYWEEAIIFFKEIIMNYEAEGLTNVENIDEELKNWKNYHDIFVNDNKQFDEILSDINFTTFAKYNHDPIAYAEATENSQNKNKAKYFLDFYSKVNYLTSYATKLFTINN